MRRLFVVLVVFICAAVLAFGQAEKREVSIAVRATTQVVSGGVLHLNGAVEITTPDLIVRCDEAHYNVVTGDIEAKGHVQLSPPSNPPIHVSSGDIEINPSKKPRGMKLLSGFPR